MPSQKKILNIVPRPSATLPVLRPIGEENFPATGNKGEVLDDKTPWGRNPFLTAEEEAGERPREGDGLQVKAIIMGWPKSVATIDGRTVAVGEKVGEETVQEIRSDAVVLERDGNRRILRVSEPSISIRVRDVKK